MLRQDGSFSSQKERRATAAAPAAASPCSVPLSEAERERFATLLVLVAHDHDRAAFGELFAFYAPRVKSYLLRLGADVSLAEDIAEEVMTDVWSKAPQFHPGQGSVSTWIFRIARSRRTDAYRMPMRPDVDAPEPMVLPMACVQPDLRTTGLEKERHVRSAMLDLSPEHRELLRLSFYEGRTHREIARQWGLPIAAVQHLIHAALLSLQGLCEFAPVADVRAGEQTGG